MILLLHTLQYMILLLPTSHDPTAAYPAWFHLVRSTWPHCCTPYVCGSAVTHILWSFCCTPHMILLQSTYSTWSYYCIFYISSVIYSTYLTFMLPALNDLALHVYLPLSILQYSTWFCCKPFYIILMLPIPNIPAVITLHDPTAPYCKWS
jgi:hypothetical protein